MNLELKRFAGTWTTVGAEIHHLATTTSTMDVAWKHVQNGAPDGTVIVADHQSAGRGRYDRSWESTAGQDILCSVILRPRVALAGELLMIAALAVVDVVESFRIECGIKWPNDVQVSGKKIAGVIAESRTGPDSTSLTDSDVESDTGSDLIAAVLGIGLNVNFEPATAQDAPNSTSLFAESGQSVNRFDVFRLLLESLDNHYASIASGGTVVPLWRNKLSTIGREVTIVRGGDADSTDLRGLAHDIDSMGRLIVRDAEGRDWPVSSGEVTVKDIR